MLDVAVATAWWLVTIQNVRGGHDNGHYTQILDGGDTLGDTSQKRRGFPEVGRA